MHDLARLDRLASASLFFAELGARGLGATGLDTARLAGGVERLRSRWEADLHRRLSSREAQRLRPAARIAGDDVEGLRRAHRAATPVIIEGLYDDWPARKTWTMPLFRERWGDRRFEVNVQHTGHRGTDFREMALCDIIDSFDRSGEGEGELNYIMFSPVLKTIPELRDDLDLSTVRRFAGLADDRRVWVKLFFGPAGTRTSLHMAPQSNLFFQVHGEKRWVMFPPEQSPLVHPNRILPTGLPYFFSNYGYSDTAGSRRFPLTAHLEGWDIHLKSGDALWVPPFHWHWVEALTPSISLSTWWYDPLIALRESPFYFLLSLPGMAGILAGRYDVDDFDTERTRTIRDRLAALRGRGRGSA